MQRRRDVAAWIRQDALAVVSAPVLVVDDHRLFAQSLAVRVDREPGLQVVGIATAIADARELVPGLGVVRPAAVTLDLTPDCEAGLDFIRWVAASAANVRTVVVTSLNDPAVLYAALCAGATGWVMKSVSSERLVQALRSVLAGESVAPAELLRAAVLAAAVPIAPPSPAVERLATLTSREREVLALIAAGLPSRDIAARLYVSLNTVRTHTQRVLAKLGVHSRREAGALLTATSLAVLNRSVAPADAVPRQPPFAGEPSHAFEGNGSRG